ncbi:MAG: (Fe-S)-binding protein [Coriobacteriia bacterium]|nr:(Fe-S)-binding protein [Coriobacteriia bacterium]MCL2749645.1 (Fe-S)-binding protein [Coriobacteriia bacterium]
MQSGEAFREIFWNIDHHWLMQALLVLVLFLFVFFLVRIIRLTRIGIPVARSDRPGKRLWGSFRDAILQVKVLSEKKSGIIHAMMYFGFLVLLVCTITIAFDTYLGTHFINGHFYLYVISLGGDIAGLLFCAGVAAAIVRRAVNKNLETKVSDIIILVILLLVGITGFTIEGLRIAAADDPWRMWSPIGNLVAYAFSGIDEMQLVLWHRVFWWIHLVLAFAAIGTWTCTKLVHTFLIPLILYRRQLDNAAILPFVDLEDMDIQEIGVHTIRDFTTKDLLDSEACIRCSRCNEVCPAFTTGKTLVPMGFMQGVRAQLRLEGPEIKATRRHKHKNDVTEGVQGARKELTLMPVVGASIKKADLWQCVTCGACTEACPASIEIAPKVVKIRTHQVSMEGAFPNEAQSTFRALETNGNPWGTGWQKRMDRLADLEVLTFAEHPNAEWLYWPGCSGAFDDRNNKVTAAVTQILKATGVDFAVLGNEERCCGDAARRMGNEYVYYQLASRNIAALESYGIKKILTQCPHCLTALSVDYPQLGGSYEVIHHTQLIQRLIGEGRLKPSRDLSASLAYHDSCYLGRYNHVLKEPRLALAAAGASIVEPNRHGKAGFCCGAGGGGMWLEESQGTRINVERAKQLLSTNASQIVTGCPFCLTMLSDGIKALDSEVSVCDVAEIIWNSTLYQSDRIEPK